MNQTFDNWWAHVVAALAEDGYEREAEKYKEISEHAYKAGRLAEREEIAQMFDAEHEKRQGVDNFAQCAAVAIRSRK